MGVPIATVSLGFLYDGVGSYRPGMMIGLVATVISMALVEVVLRMGKKLPMTSADEDAAEA